MKRYVLVTAFCLLSVASAAHASGSSISFPNEKIVSLVVPFGAGGATDRVARELAAVMPNYLGGTMIVENNAGAGGTIGAKKVKQAKADGYTILIHHIGLSTAPALYKNLGFDPIADLEPVGEIADVPMILVGNKNLPAENLNDLLTVIRKKSNVSFANSGIGSASHLCGLIFQQAIQVAMTTVPYKGSGPVLNDVLGGQVDMTCEQTTALAGHLQANSLSTYALMQKTRVGAFPNIPTAAEQGLTGVDVTNWHGMYVPKGTPKEVIAKLTQALQKTVTDSSFRAKMTSLGGEAVGQQRATPESLKSVLRSEIAKWGPIIKKAGAYAD